jgi:hypothetical protein
MDKNSDRQMLTYDTKKDNIRNVNKMIKIIGIIVGNRKYDKNDIIQVNNKK